VRDLINTLIDTLRGAVQLRAVGRKVFPAHSEEFSDRKLEPPYIGIADAGEEAGGWLASGSREEWKNVELVLIQKIQRDRRAGGSVGAQDVVALAQDVRDVLDGNRLGRYQDMKYLGSDPVEAMEMEEDEYLLMKRLRYSWLLRRTDVATS